MRFRVKNYFSKAPFSHFVIHKSPEPDVSGEVQVRDRGSGLNTVRLRFFLSAKPIFFWSAQVAAKGLRVTKD